MKKSYGHLLSFKQTHNDFKDIKKDKNTAPISIYFSNRAMLLSAFSILFSLALLLLPCLYTLSDFWVVTLSIILLIVGFGLSSLFCILGFINTCYQLFVNRRLHGPLNLILWVANLCIILVIFLSCDLSFLF